MNAQALTRLFFREMILTVIDEDFLKEFKPHLRQLILSSDGEHEVTVFLTGGGFRISWGTFSCILEHESSKTFVGNHPRQHMHILCMRSTRTYTFSYHEENVYGPVDGGEDYYNHRSLSAKQVGRYNVLHAVYNLILEHLLEDDELAA